MTHLHTHSAFYSLGFVVVVIYELWMVLWLLCTSYIGVEAVVVALEVTVAVEVFVVNVV